MPPSLPAPEKRRERGLLGTLSTRVARRLLVVFLLLGVGPALLTLGLTQLRSREALREHGMPRHGLKLELTESLLMDEPREVERRLEALAALGVSLALDDFGTGYSSLTYLKRLPMDTIKLDRSFVRDLLERQEARELLRSAIAMLHALRKQVVVEGVELAAQRELLSEWGADMLQGWLFSQSLPAQALADYVRRGLAAPVAGVTANDGGTEPAGGATPTPEAAALLRPTPGSVGLAGQPQTLEQPLELFRT